MSQFYRNSNENINKILMLINIFEKNIRNKKYLKYV